MNTLKMAISANSNVTERLIFAPTQTHVDSSTHHKEKGRPERERPCLNDKQGLLTLRRPQGLCRAQKRLLPFQRLALQQRLAVQPAWFQ